MPPCAVCAAVKVADCAHVAGGTKIAPKTIAQAIVCRMVSAVRSACRIIFMRSVRSALWNLMLV